MSIQVDYEQSLNPQRPLFDYPEVGTKVPSTEKKKERYKVHPDKAAEFFADPNTNAYHADEAAQDWLKTYAVTSKSGNNNPKGLNGRLKLALQAHKKWSDERDIQPLSLSKEVRHDRRMENISGNLDNWGNLFSDEGFDKEIERRGLTTSYNELIDRGMDEQQVRGNLRRKLFTKDLSGQNDALSQARVSQHILGLEDQSDEAYVSGAQSWVEGKRKYRDEISNARKSAAETFFKRKVAVDWGLEAQKKVSPEAADAYLKSHNGFKKQYGDIVPVVRDLVDNMKAEGARGLFEETEEVDVNWGKIMELYGDYRRDDFLYVLGKISEQEEVNVDGFIARNAKGMSRTVERMAKAGMRLIDQVKTEASGVSNESLRDRQWNQFQADIADLKGNVARIEASNDFEKIANFTTASLPYMAFAATGVGTGLIAATEAQQMGERAREANPNLTYAEVMTVALPAGAVYAGIEKLQVGGLLGKFPGMQKVANKFTSGTSLGAWSRRIAATTLYEYGQETLQDAVEPLSRDIANQFKAEVPEGDWSTFEVLSWDRLLGVIGLSALGGTGQWARDRFTQQEVKEELQDKFSLQLTGATLEEANEIAEMAEKDPDAALQQYKKKVFSKSVEERKEISEAAIKSAEDAVATGVLDGLPVVTSNEGGGFVVDFKDGTKKTVESREEAQVAIDQRMEENFLDSAQAVRDRMDNLLETSEGDNKAKIAKPRTFQELADLGVETVERLKEAVAVSFMQRGEAVPENIDLNNYTEQGSVTLRRKMAGFAVRLAKDKMTLPSTVDEEFSEGFLRMIVEQGETTFDEVKTMLDEFGSIAGIDMTQGYDVDPNRAVIEGFSKFAKAYMLQGDHKSIPKSSQAWYRKAWRVLENPDSVPAILRSWAELVTKLLRSVFDVAQAIKSQKQDGKGIDPELESLAMRALGLNEQQIAEDAQAKATKEIQEEFGLDPEADADPTFSITPARNAKGYSDLLGEVESAIQEWSSSNQAYESAETLEEMQDSVAVELQEEGVDLDTEEGLTRLEEAIDAIDYSSTKEGVLDSLQYAKDDAESGVQGALERFLEPIGYEVESIETGSPSSFYFEIAPDFETQEWFEENAPDFDLDEASAKIRFSDHANTSRLHSAPDANIQPGESIKPQFDRLFNRLPNLTATKDTSSPSFSITPKDEKMSEAVERLFAGPKGLVDTGRKLRSKLSKIREKFEANLINAEGRDKDTRELETLNSLMQLNALRSVMPKEVRDSVGSPLDLVKLKTAKPRERNVIRRLEKMEKALNKYHQRKLRGKIEKGLKKSKFKVSDSRKREGKIGQLGHKVVEHIELVKGDSLQGAEARKAELTQTFEEIETPTSEDFERWDSLTLATDLFYDYENATTARLEQALDFVTTNYKEGRKEWLAELERRREERDQFVKEAISFMGDKDLAEIGEIEASTRATNESRKGLKKFTSGVAEFLFSNHHTLARIVENAKDKKAAKDWYNRLLDSRIQGDLKTEVEANEKQAAFKEKIREIIGARGKLVDHNVHKFLYEAKQPRINEITVLEVPKTKEVAVPKDAVGAILRGETNGFDGEVLSDADIELLREAAAEFDQLSKKKQGNRQSIKFERLLSEGARKPVGKISHEEALQWWLTMRQPDQREKLEKLGWDEQMMQEISDFIPDNVKELGLWMSNNLVQEGVKISSIHAKEYGVELNTGENYFPVQNKIYDGRAEIDLNDPGAGRGISTASLKERVVNKELPAQVGAFGTYLRHVTEMAYWKNNVSWVRQYGGAFKTKEFAKNMENRVGVAAYRNLNKYMASVSNKGASAAQEMMDIARLTKGFMSRAALAILGSRMSTVIINGTGFLNALGSSDVSAAQVLRHSLGALIDGKGDMKETWRNDLAVLRRDQGSSFLAQQAMKTGQAGHWIFRDSEKVAQLGMIPMNVTDVASNTVTMVGIYRATEKAALKRGVSPEIAKAEADAAVTRAHATLAQPALTVSKSLMEQQSASNPFMAILTFFMSEVRKNAANNYVAWRTLLTGKGIVDRKTAARQAALYTAAYPVVTQGFRAVLNMFLGDDDKDEEIMQQMQDPKFWMYAAASDNLAPIPFAGDAVQSIIAGPLDQKYWEKRNTFQGSVAQFKQFDRIWDEEETDSARIDEVIDQFQAWGQFIPGGPLFSQAANVADFAKKAAEGGAGYSFSESDRINKIRKGIEKNKKAIFEDNEDRDTRWELLEDVANQYKQENPDVWDKVMPVLTEKEILPREILKKFQR